VTETDRALEEAQAVARRPVEERLHGDSGPDAENVILRLLTEAGVSYRDASRLTNALYWQGWNDHKTQTSDKENGS